MGLNCFIKSGDHWVRPRFVPVAHYRTAHAGMHSWSWRTRRDFRVESCFLCGDREPLPCLRVIASNQNR